MTAPLPESKEWNHFWSLKQTERFTKVSWSKMRIMAVLARFLCPGQRALDAGCGSGFFSRVFCDASMVTTALDYSQKALDIARDKTEGRSKLIRADLVNDDLSARCSEPFHLIFTDGLLEHFTREDQLKILNNFRRVLHPDGVIVTFVPNRFSPWELIRPLYMPGIEEKPFVLGELIRLHQDAGLAIKKSGGLNTLPFAFSPDAALGRWFGMLLYTIASKS